MTGDEWEAADRPGPMLAGAAGRLDDRALRLFACACARRHWPLFVDPRSRAAIETAERAADGFASAEELAAARRAARAAGRTAAAARDAARRALAGAAGDRGNEWEAGEELRARSEEEAAAWLAWELLRTRTGPADAASAATAFGAEVAAERGTEAAERAAQADLLRCLAGNPFRPPPRVDPGWILRNDGTAGRIARVVAEGRAFDRLPLLADALEEAGCAEAAFLGHLRSPGGHARGCWVLTLLLDPGGG